MIELWLSLLALLLVTLGGLYVLAKHYGVHNLPVMRMALISLPVMVLLSYWPLGEPGLVAQQSQQKAAEQATLSLVDQLEARLAEQPEDVQGWMMLGHSHTTLDHRRKAVAAFERAYQLEQNNPTVILALAESLAALEQGVYNLRAQALVATARRLAPDNLDILWASALVARQNGDLDQAIADLSAMQQGLEPDSQARTVIDNLLKELLIIQSKS